MKDGGRSGSVPAAAADQRGDAEERDDIGRFYAYYTETALQTLLQDAGFDILDSRTDESRGMLGRMDKGLHIMARKRTG